jgi:hypothetical protein
VCTSSGIQIGYFLYVADLAPVPRIIKQCDKNQNILYFLFLETCRQLLVIDTYGYLYFCKTILTLEARIKILLEEI